MQEFSERAINAAHTVIMRSLGRIIKNHFEPLNDAAREIEYLTGSIETRVIVHVRNDGTLPEEQRPIMEFYAERLGYELNLVDIHNRGINPERAYFDPAPIIALRDALLSFALDNGGDPGGAQLIQLCAERHQLVRQQMDIVAALSKRERGFGIRA